MQLSWKDFRENYLPKMSALGRGLTEVRNPAQQEGSDPATAPPTGPLSVSQMEQKWVRQAGEGGQPGDENSIAPMEIKYIQNGVESNWVPPSDAIKP